MCGIVGIVSQESVAPDLYDALMILQHRGQDAAGIVTCDEGHLNLRKANGLVSNAILPQHLYRLKGPYGIGHVRYPTAGSSNEAEAQPLYVNSPYGIALAHNGNLTNAQTLKKSLKEEGLRHLNTNSDSEIILNVFAEELHKLHKANLQKEDIFQAISALHRRTRGAYAIVALIADYGLVGFRDPHGIRPLCLGKRVHEKGTDYMIASESVALHNAGYELIGDVEPGEAVCITKEGELHRAQCADAPTNNPCLFEYVYLARPDSIIASSSVYKVRLKLGEFLAKKLLQIWPDHDIDVVIPVPETSRTAAHAMARALGLKYREGFIKNYYIGRTFIMPGQKVRKKSVQQKLNTIDLEFEGKNVLLVDDSIVRGTTSKEIIQMARDSGAKKVYFASAAPEVKYPNVYGIDMPSAQELIAHNRSVEEVCEFIGADWLIYQDLKDLVAAVKTGNPNIDRFEDSVFSGNYITGDVDEAYLHYLDKCRNDKAKESKGFDAWLRSIDLYS